MFLTNNKLSLFAGHAGLEGFLPSEFFNMLDLGKFIQMPIIDVNRRNIFIVSQNVILLVKFRTLKSI